MMAGSKTLVIVAGPTAVGKTACSIALAQHFNTEILSFDSRQCYRELNIGVARPTAAELQAVPHYFIATHSVHQPADAAIFEQYALDTLSQLFTKQEVVVAVGGTGLYLKALCEGLDFMPPIAAELRQQIRQEYDTLGMEWLQQALVQEDPTFAAGGEMKNPHRMLRALEVMRSSGQSIRHFQRNAPVERPFKMVKIGLELPKSALNERIDRRVQHMMQEGQVAEATGLFAHQNLPALQTVGYTELFNFLAGNISLENAVESIAIHTRQYAKRQLTWFKRDAAMKWFSPNQMGEILSWTEAQVASIQTSRQK